MTFSWFKARKARRTAAARLYDVAAAQSRLPEFYARLGVGDTIDGRFDLLILHVFLMMERLGALGPEGHRLAQSLFDCMFRMTDRTLREMGIGDLGVPKHMKKMMKAFNGRARSYHEALALQNADAMQLAITRNIFRAEGEAIPEGARDIALYAMTANDRFAQLSLNDFMTGSVHFPAVTEQRREAAVA